MKDLSGTKTSTGWSLVEKVKFDSDHTGAKYSDCYFCTHPKKGSAFLKLLDTSRIDIRELANSILSFEYEIDLAKLSTTEKLSRVLRLIESGYHEVDAEGAAALRSVPYLIFERGFRDARKALDDSEGAMPIWMKFSVLHQAASGIFQLHRINIAHQDVKLSNLVEMSDGVVKVADLGRSSRRGVAAPHDNEKIPGANKYAPFELSYSELSPEWNRRRLATDVFHLGCLVCVLFTDVILPLEVYSRMDAAHRPQYWGDSYQAVLPHIKKSFEQVLDEISSDLPERFQSELTVLIRDLCDPDPRTRGSRLGSASKVGTTLWLEKFVSLFNRLEKTSRLFSGSANA